MCLYMCMYILIYVYITFYTHTYTHLFTHSEFYSSSVLFRLKSNLLNFQGDFPLRYIKKYAHNLQHIIKLPVQLSEPCFRVEVCTC